MPSAIPSEAPITNCNPLWHALGVSADKRGRPVYWLDVRGRVRSFRPVELWGYPFLTEIHPDMGYWRMMFPQGRGYGVDRNQALRYFIRVCEKAGEYVPINTP